MIQGVFPNLGILVSLGHPGLLWRSPWPRRTALVLVRIGLQQKECSNKAKETGATGFSRK